MGSLKGLRLSQQSRKRYAQAYGRFGVFRAERGAAPDSLEELDLLACEFIEATWHEGDPKLGCSDLLASLHFYLLTCRRHLHGAWELLEAWEKAELPCRACPITAEMLLGLCGALVQSGFWRDAFLALAGFHLLLRTGEILTLRAGDLMLRSDGTVSVVRLRDTKGQKLKGDHEAVEVHDPAVSRLLAVLAEGLSPADLLLPSRSEYWRHRWNLAVRRVSLEDAHIKSYSLRRGGATAHFRELGHDDRTVERGRWGNVATARRYVDEGVASLADCDWRLRFANCSTLSEACSKSTPANACRLESSTKARCTRGVASPTPKRKQLPNKSAPVPV